MESDSTDSNQDSGTGSFSQDDIDALLNGGGDGDGANEAPGEPTAPTPTPDTNQPDGVGFSQDDIDALMNAAGESSDAPDTSPPTDESESAAPKPDTRLDSLGRPFDEAAAAMQAAIEEEQAAAAAAASAPPAASPSPPPPTAPFDFPDLGEPGKFGIDPKRVSMLNDVKLRVKIELGRTRMFVEDVLKLDEGSVVELDKLAGDPVDVFVNDRLVARGEVLVLNDSFCVRVSEVLSHDPHRVIV